MEASSFAMAFEGCHSKSEYFFTYQVLNEIIGEASYFASGGPGKGIFARSVKYLRDCRPCTKISSINNVYQDTGLFGVTLNGFDKNNTKLLYDSA